MIECPECHALYSISIKNGIATCYSCGAKFKLKKLREKVKKQ